MGRNRLPKDAVYLRVLSSWLTVFVATLAVRADDDVPASLADRFADEPNRPKAQAPIRFLESFHEARVEAGRSHRRILAYFTGRYCGWCRVMEKRTLTDAEVVALAQSFVCVKLDAAEGASALRRAWGRGDPSVVHPDC